MEQKYKGKVQGKISRFLTQAEFDGEDLTRDLFQNETEVMNPDTELNF